MTPVCTPSAPLRLNSALTGSLIRALTTTTSSSAPREQVAAYWESRARILFRVAISEELKAFSLWNSRSRSDTWIINYHVKCKVNIGYLHWFSNLNNSVEVCRVYCTE